MNGWNGLILHINLSNKTYRFEHPDSELYRTWIGGRGLAGFYLFPYVTLPWDNPEMPLVLMAGPLVGTSAPSSGQICVMSRSPLTSTVGDGSMGGSFGTELKKAGLDGIVITGRSDRICGIAIADKTIQFEEAETFSQMKTVQVYKRLKHKGAVAVVGPAAENRVLFANVIVNGGFSAGRNGLGLVFASKGLKYITVKGSGQVSIYDQHGLQQAREDILRLIAASPALLGQYGISQYGTGALYDLIDSRHMMPTANFRRTHFEKAKVMNAVAFAKKYRSERTGCQGCHILCKKIVHEGLLVPEFEAMSHFSALLEIEDMEIVMEANRLCNDLGMDAVSAAATLACYAEYRGEKLSGYEVLALLNNIGTGQEKQLAQGSYIFASKIGKPELSMTVKGQELPPYDPRGAYGMALGYSVSTSGGCHLRAFPISHEILRKPVATDRFSFEGKARIIKIAEDMNALVDSLSVCRFVFLANPLEEYAKAYTAVTGVESTVQELLKIGERICYNERIMNASNGFTSKDDDLPRRFFTEPGTSGKNFEVPAINREEFLRARANYYRVRGLDNNGMPTKQKAQGLGLIWER